MVHPATTSLSFCIVYSLNAFPLPWLIFGIMLSTIDTTHIHTVRWVLCCYCSSMTPSLWTLWLTHSDLVWIIFGLLTCLFHDTFVFFVPVVSPNLGILWLFTSALSCSGSTLIWVLSLLLSSLCLLLLLCLIYVPWFTYIWIIRNTMACCWISTPENNWCLHSGLGNLVSNALLNWNWYMPNVLHVLHDYSACFHHSHSVGLPSVVFAVAINNHAMHPETPSSIWTTTVDPAEKNIESLYHYSKCMLLTSILRLCNTQHHY